MLSFNATDPQAPLQSVNSQKVTWTTFVQLNDLIWNTFMESYMEYKKEIKGNTTVRNYSLMV